jgi:hypothetical protein
MRPKRFHPTVKFGLNTNSLGYLWMRIFNTFREAVPRVRATRTSSISLNRIVLGNRVVDHERVWGVRDALIEIAAVYEVVETLIERVWFFAPQARRALW